MGQLLLILIRQGDSSISTKLSGYYVLADLFKGSGSGQNESPFMPALVSCFEQINFEHAGQLFVEKFFIGQLLVNGSKDLGKQTPTQIARVDIGFMKDFINDVLWHKLPQIKRSLNLPASVACALSTVIPGTSRQEPTDRKGLLEDLCKQSDECLRGVFLPEFITVAPPLLPCEDELVWFDLTNPAYFKPLYDPTLCSEASPGSEAKRLMAQAFKQALTTHDQQRLSAAMDAQPELINEMSGGLLTPQKLPELVENNPLVAIHVLLKLMDSDQITEYFCVLVSMELSLHSIEVVNRLTNSVELPLEFVHLYISNCISTCETIKEKYMQSRLVRLVCVFLQSLIRNKIINVKELFLELESFCIEFSFIREAAALYRLLKQLDTDQTPSGTG